MSVREHDEAVLALVDVAAAAGAASCEDEGLRTVAALPTAEAQAHGVVALAEGLLAAGTAWTTGASVELLERLERAMTVGGADARGRAAGLLARLLAREGRRQEAHGVLGRCRDELTALGVVPAAHALDAYLAVGRRDEALSELQTAAGDGRALSVALLRLGEAEAAARVLSAVAAEDERVRGIEDWLPWLDGATWDRWLPSVVATVATAELRARALGALGLRLVELDVARGMPTVVAEGVAWARRCTGYGRGVALVPWIEVLGRKCRPREAVAVVDDIVPLAMAASSTGAREGLLSAAGRSSARGGMLDGAVRLAALVEDEERRADVEVACVERHVADGRLQAARHLAGRVNHPDGRVRAAAAVLAAQMDERGAAWVLRQTRVVLELGDMRGARLRAVARLAPVVLRCRDAEPDGTADVFAELLDMVTPVGDATSRRAA